jgi:hypothetical protein
LSGNSGPQINNGLDITDVNSSGAAFDLAQDFFEPNLLSATASADPLAGFEH